MKKNNTLEEWQIEIFYILSHDKDGVQTSDSKYSNILSKLVLSQFIKDLFQQRDKEVVKELQAIIAEEGVTDEWKIEELKSMINILSSNNK